MNGHVAFENTATSGVACRESVRDARRAGSDINVIGDFHSSEVLVIPVVPA